MYKSSIILVLALVMMSMSFAKDVNITEKECDTSESVNLNLGILSEDVSFGYSYVDEGTISTDSGVVSDDEVFSEDEAIHCLVEIGNDTYSCWFCNCRKYTKEILKRQ